MQPFLPSTLIRDGLCKREAFSVFLFFSKSLTDISPWSNVVIIFVQFQKIAKGHWNFLMVGFLQDNKF